MRGLTQGLFHIAVALWAGSLWIVGYVAAPILFSSLDDRVLAGQIAGRMFSVAGWIGFGCAAYALGFLLIRRGTRCFSLAAFWLAVAMLTLTLVGHFGVAPILSQLKAQSPVRDVMESLLRDRFVVWHGVSSVLHLVESVLGLFLVAAAARTGK